jgi:hypothetical protein
MAATILGRAQALACGTFTSPRTASPPRPLSSKLRLDTDSHLVFYQNKNTATMSYYNATTSAELRGAKLGLKFSCHTSPNDQTLSM